MVVRSISAQRRALAFLVLVAGLGVPCAAAAEAAVGDAGADTALTTPQPEAEAALPASLSLLERGLIPVGGVLGANLTIWAFDRYVLDADYARISPETMAANLTRGFAWDADTFMVNQFGHPYQGGLYHNASRAAGNDFWTSIPFAALGSLQWEFFMESEPPAINDFVTTTLGGAVVGEALLRTARLIRDDSSVGFERVARELAAAVFDPGGGLGRVFSGAASRQGLAPQRSPFLIDLSAGLDRTTFAEAREGRFRSLHLETRLAHGGLPAPGEGVAPFDYFTASVGFNVGQHESATLLDVNGVLAGLPFGCGGGRCLVAAAQHFAYRDGPAFKVGTTALGAGFYAELPLWVLDVAFAAELMGVPVGGFDSADASAWGPQYNMGPGATSRADLAINLGRWQLAFESRRYFISTVHGAPGTEFAGLSRVSLRVPLWQPLSLELGSALFDRVTRLQGEAPALRRVIVGQTRLVWSFGSSEGDSKERGL